MSKVLIVDDNQQNLYMLQVLLSSNGFQTELASNGAEALEHARRAPPDMIISDILMPVMDGYALCRAWKEDERLKDIPFIFYTATYTDPKDEDFALSLGADRFIVKPAAPDTLLALILETRDKFKAGGPVAAPRPVDETEYYQEYSATLIRKLENKLLQLEEANRILAREFKNRRRAEDALVRANAYFENVFENSPDAIGVVDTSGRFVKWNKMAEKLYGYTFEEMRRMSPFDLYADQAELERMLVRLRKAGSVQQWEMLMRKGDGGVAPFEISIGLLRDGENRTLGSIAVARDLSEIKETLAALRAANDQLNQEIEERKLMEDALRLSEERFSTVFHASAVSIAIARLADSKLIDINDAWLNITGLTREEAIGHTTIGLNLWANPGDRDRLLGILRERNTVHDFEVQLRKRSGTILDVLMSAELVELAGEKCVLSSAQDITRLKQAEAALRESESRFRNLVEGAPEAIFVQQGGRFVYLNPAMVSLLGGSKPEELIDREFMARVAPEYRDSVQSRISLQRETGNPAAPIEQEYLRLDGSRVPVETTTVPIRFRGGDAHLVFLRDITERKYSEAEQARAEMRLRQAQKMEAIGTMAGGIAHDFNNILGIMFGFTEMTLLELPRDSVEANNLREALQAGKRAKDLVKQILAFSRISKAQAGSLQVRPIVKEAVKMLRAALPSTIEIRQKIEVYGEGVVLADPTQIHQILMNLATNAHHAMLQRGGVLEVGLSHVDFGPNDAALPVGLEQGAYVRIVVSDTGHGIAPEIIERIFEPYFTTKPLGEGTGLGLSVIHGIVQSLGGAIAVASQLGNGSTFCVYLPEAESEVASQTDAPVTIMTGCESILFVDDEPGLANTGRTMLQKLGYKVLSTTSSVEALEAFLAAPDNFDLVITDQTMPDITGAELAKQIMRTRPDTPIILCTGYSDTVTAAEAEAMGIRKFVMKPLDMRDLAAIVRRVLDGKRSAK
ncbi:MAG: PAS domain S-box protein [Syntrophobacteraceae bacterium]